MTPLIQSFLLTTVVIVFAMHVLRVVVLSRSMIARAVLTSFQVLVGVTFIFQIVVWPVDTPGATNGTLLALAGLGLLGGCSSLLTWVIAGNDPPSEPS